MGAIQGAINQMITSAAIGVGATQKIKADVKEADTKALQAGVEAKEKEAQSKAIEEASKKFGANTVKQEEAAKGNNEAPIMKENIPTVAQFIRNATSASLAADKSYQQMLKMQQGMALKKKSLLDLI